jgi:hypothetical protein
LLFAICGIAYPWSLLGCRHLQNSLRKKRLKKLNGGLALLPDLGQSISPVVQAPGSRLLTTQLYFPNEPANLRDSLFQSELLMRVADAGDDLDGRFDFVLDVR